MDESNLGAHDPFQALKKNINSSVKPNDIGVSNKNGRAEKASNDLAAVEKKAGEGLNETATGVAGAKAAEEESEGLYSGDGRGVDESPKVSGLYGIAKKGGPLAALLLLVSIVGGLFLGNQSLQPFGLVAEFQEAFNSMHVSAEIRSERFFMYQMKKRKTKSPYNIYGTDFSISKKQQEELGKHGIEYDEEYKIDGKKTKVLKYTDMNGKEKIVTADNFKQTYATDNDFFSRYNAGSMTWRGAFANWFGTNTRNFLKNNKLTRNMFEKYKEKVDSEGGKDSPEVQRRIVQETLKENIKPDGELRFRVSNEGEDDDGNAKVTPDSGEEGSISRGVDSEMAVRSKIDDISSKYNSGANIACAVMNTIGAISLLVTANEAIQIINLTTSFFEAVDKTKAGFGDESPILVYTQALNERKKSSNVVIEGEDSESMEPVAVVRERTAMESAGVAGLFSRKIVNPNDPSVSSFNVTSSIKKIMGGLGVSVAAFKGCTLAKMGGAAISGAMDALKIAACVGGVFATPVSGGLSLAGCGPLVASFGVQVGLGFAVGAILTKVVGLLIPTVSSMLMRDLIAQLGGEDLGNALTYGANLYQGSTHRSNGGSLSSMDKYKQFAIEQQRVIADKARYERSSLSPFDTTSKYTFMGSIMTNLMNFSHANSIMSTITAGGSVVSSSLASLSGTANAINTAVELPDSIDEYAEVCPYLASINAIGDSFCNPYVVSDTGTMDTDPDDVLEKVQELGGFSSSSGDNVTIDSNSQLANYIKYCDNRQSSFGIVDQNIANEVGGTGTTDSGALNGAIGAVPIVGDALEIIDDAEQLANIGYISGESCVAGNNVESHSSPNWSEAQYYQRFIEDQSLAESMGVIEKSAVATFLEDYYKENPIDNSYEGMLARYSGLDKESVVALLDIAEYENYIASYDPSDRYVFGEIEEQDNNDEEIFNQENVMDGVAVALGQIVYADVRNRYFVV